MTTRLCEEIVVSALLVMLCAVPSYAATPNGAITSDKYFRDLRCAEQKQQYMTGNWQEVRFDLEQKGATFSSTFVADILGDVSGGMMQGARYCSSMDWDVNFDLEKFAGLIGAQFHISGLWRTGQNLSSAVIGNAFAVSSIFGTEQFRLYGLYLEKTFLDKRINVRVGRMSTGDDFASDSIYWNFVSNAIDNNPASIPLNLFFSCYPIAVWGARAQYNITKTIYGISGIYDGDPGVQQERNYGLDFSLRLKRGILFAQEIGCTPVFKGLPGHYKAGFYYDSGVFRDLYSDVNGLSSVVTGAPAAKHIGNYGLYFHADQTIYSPRNCPCEEGLTPFVMAVIAPDNINKFPFFIDGGLVYKGLIPTRHHDITSVGFAYGRYSNSIYRSERDDLEANGNHVPLQTYELIFDFSHKIEITPWMFLQPDMQYIVNPSGKNNIPDAFVVGTRFGLTF